jgi:hypothetical protein
VLSLHESSIGPTIRLIERPLIVRCRSQIESVTRSRPTRHHISADDYCQPFCGYRESRFYRLFFIDCPIAAAAAAIPSGYFVPTILDQPFRSTITKYSSTKRFTTSSTIKSSTSIRCSAIKSSIAEYSSTNYSVLFYLPYFTALAICIYYYYYYRYNYCHYYYYYYRYCYYF